MRIVKVVTRANQKKKKIVTNRGKKGKKAIRDSSRRE